MTYSNPNTRFKFWNGSKGFTLEYASGIGTWFLFKDEETTNALISKRKDYKYSKQINVDEAFDVFYELLEEINTKIAKP